MLFIHYLLLLLIYTVITLIITIPNYLLYWIIFNIPVILIEIIGYINRFNLTKLDNKSIFFSEIVNINDFINKIWEEYGRIDNRYLDENRHYVWYFELGNVIIILLFLFIYIFKDNAGNIIKSFSNNLNYKKLIYILLVIQILNCLAYFISYFYDYLKEKIIENKRNINITKTIIYLSISSIWIFIPLFLLQK